MDGSPEAVISLGLGSWGSSGLVLTLGLGVGETVEVNITSDTYVMISRSAAKSMLHATEQDDAITIAGSGLVLATDTTILEAS